MAKRTNNELQRDAKSGQFLKGHTGQGGRPKGSRNKLGEQFLRDLADVWEESGTDALCRCAQEDPTGFCKIIASLLPRDVNLNVDINATTIAENFRNAIALLGNELPPMPAR